MDGIYILAAGVDSPTIFMNFPIGMDLSDLYSHFVTYGNIYACPFVFGEDGRRSCVILYTSINGVIASLISPFKVIRGHRIICCENMTRTHVGTQMMQDLTTSSSSQPAPERNIDYKVFSIV